jgi:hypothetical protein
MNTWLSCITTIDSLLSPPELLPTGPPSSHTAIPLPSEAIYSSKKELYASIQAWAAQYSYAFRIRRSKKYHNSPRLKVIYNCDYYGPLPPEKHPEDYLQARKR